MIKTSFAARRVRGADRHKPLRSQSGRGEIQHQKRWRCDHRSSESDIARSSKEDRRRERRSVSHLDVARLKRICIGGKFQRELLVMAIRECCRRARSYVLHAIGDSRSHGLPEVIPAIATASCGAGTLTGSRGAGDGAGAGCGTAGFGIASGISRGCEPG